MFLNPAQFSALSDAAPNIEMPRVVSPACPKEIVTPLRRAGRGRRDGRRRPDSRFRRFIAGRSKR
jgi:hypothetical protein